MAPERKLSWLTRMRCAVFGHDMRVIEITKPIMYTVHPMFGSHWRCGRCGREEGERHRFHV